MTHRPLLVLGVLAALACGPALADTTLFSQWDPALGVPMGGPYAPPGTLYDNEQGNNTTSLASQDSTGTFTARTADDFTIVDAACASNQFDITRVRIQMVQADAAPQAFAVDLYDDDGTGTAPTAGISPFTTLSETSQMVFGPFGAGTSIFEASFDITPGTLTLDGNTVYWISGWGTDAAANAAGFNNFFAASNGATGTTANGVIIAPGAGVPAWTPVDQVIGPPPLAFSFAIDGDCIVTGGGGADLGIPTLSPAGIALLAALLAAIAIGFMARRRRSA